MAALPEAYFRAEVLEVSDLSSVMRRIVLGGDGLVDYRSSGAPDEWFPAQAGTNRTSGCLLSYAGRSPRSTRSSHRLGGPKTIGVAAVSTPPCGCDAWVPATRMVINSVGTPGKLRRRHERTTLGNLCPSQRR